MKPEIPEGKDCKIFLVETGDKFYIHRNGQLYAVKVLSIQYATTDLRGYPSKSEYYIPNGKFLIKTKDSEIETAGSIQTRGPHNRVTLCCDFNGERDDYYIYQTVEEAKKDCSRVPFAYLSDLKFDNCVGEKLSICNDGITSGYCLILHAYSYNSNTLEIKPYSTRIARFTLDVKNAVAFPIDSTGALRNLRFWKTAYDVQKYIDAQKEKMQVFDFEEDAPEEKKTSIITIGNITTSVSEEDRQKIMKILFPK